jgi:hypothetical protein
VKELPALSRTGEAGASDGEGPSEGRRVAEGREAGRSRVPVEASFHLAQIIPTPPLASGTNNPSGDTIEESRMCWSNPPTDPSVIMIRWPDAPTITPATFKIPAAEAMKILAYASTPLRPGPGSMAC